MKKFLTKVLEVILMAVFAVGLAVIVLEWLSGCGETYIDSKGVRHQYECLFINR